MTGSGPNSPLVAAVPITCPVPTEAEVKLLEGVFPLVSSRDGDAEALARSAGVPLSAVLSAMADPVIAARLLAAQDRAEDEGRLLKPTAARLTQTMLSKLGAAAAAGELDVDDIANLLPKVHRVLEHAERMEVAKGSAYDGLTTFVIQFGARGGIAVSAAAPAPTQLVQEVFNLDSATPSAAMAYASQFNSDVIEQDDGEVDA